MLSDLFVCWSFLNWCQKLLIINRRLYKIILFIVLQIVLDNNIGIPTHSQISTSLLFTISIT